MSLRKRIMPVLFVAVVLACAPLQAVAKEMIGIAAVVNDDIVTLSDLNNRMNLYISGNPQRPTPEERKKMEQQVLNRLIDEALQLQEAKSLNITIDEDQVSQGFVNVARQNNMAPDEFKKRLAAAGVKVESLYAQIRADMAWAQVVRQKLRPQINISESEIDAALQQEQSVQGKPEYRVAEIFLAVKDPAVAEDVQKKADSIVAQLIKGASFPAVAQNVSEAPGAATGGDLGWVRPGQIDKALEAALQKMQPGQLSPPLRSDKGFHILLLRDVRHPGTGFVAPPPVAAPAARAVTETIVALKQIMIPVAATDPAPVVNAKMARAASLKEEIDSCETMARKMQDFPSPGTGDMGKGALSALPEPIRQVVENLKIGELSEPVRAPNGVAVFMVCAREEAPAAAAETQQPAPAPVPTAPAVAAPGSEASREAIANKLGGQRLDQIQERYLRDLRAAAFIDKRL